MRSRTTFNDEDQGVKPQKKSRRNKRDMLLDALAFSLPPGSDRESEQVFYDLMVKRAFNTADRASAALMKELMDRLYPTTKATWPTVSFDMPEDGTPSEKIDAINSAVAAGKLPMDMGSAMVAMIAAAVNVYEKTELAERLARVEELLAREP